MLIEILFILVLVSLSGLLSCGETSLTAANRARIHRKVSEGQRNAKRAMDVIEEKDKVMPVLLLGNNALNILATSLATLVFVELMGSGSGVVFATVVMTLALFVLGELIPKMFALHRADWVILHLSLPMQVLGKILSPLIRIVEGAVVHNMLKMLGINSRILPRDQEDLKDSIELHERDGFLVRENKNMLTSICDLEKVNVEDVMLHRKSMHTVSIEWPWEQILEYIKNHRHNYFPVWKGEPENIVGVLDTKSMLGLRDSSALQSMIRKPLFVPASRPVNRQLKFFKEEPHMALVVDEYGTIMGMVTPQDIMGEIVGRLPFDSEGQKIVRDRKNAWLVDGNTTLRDLRRTIDVKLDSRTANTVAGFIMDKVGSIPQEGQSFVFDSTKFEILEKKKNQITKVRLSTIYNRP